jgi:hypothetical protein
VRLALAHGATPLGTYSWQIHIPDDAALMRTMGPVLAARLARSPFAGWTGVFRVSFYNRGLEISFGDGVLTGTAATRAPDEAELRLPHAAFVSLALGDRSLAELREQYPDVGADGMARLLTETLFPKRASFIHTTY